LPCPVEFAEEQLARWHSRMSKSTELRWWPSGHSVWDDHERPGVAGKTHDPTLR